MDPVLCKDEFSVSVCLTGKLERGWLDQRIPNCLRQRNQNALEPEGDPGWAPLSRRDNSRLPGYAWVEKSADKMIEAAQIITGLCTFFRQLDIKNLAALVKYKLFSRGNRQQSVKFAKARLPWRS